MSIFIRNLVAINDNIKLGGDIMLTVRIEVNADSTKADTTITSKVKANISEDNIDVSLGKILYAIEEMGYPFNTDEVYQSAIEEFKSIDIGAKYVTIFSNDILKISVRRTK